MGRNNGGPSEFRIFGAMETQNPSQGGSVCMETNQKQTTNKEKSHQDAGASKLHALSFLQK